MHLIFYFKNVRKGAVVYQRGASDPLAPLPSPILNEALHSYVKYLLKPHNPPLLYGCTAIPKTCRHMDRQADMRNTQILTLSPIPAHSDLSQAIRNKAKYKYHIS